MRWDRVAAIFVTAAVLSAMAAEARAEDAAGLRQRVYAMLLDRQERAKVTEATGPSASYIGRTDSYRNHRDGKAMAACVDWSSGSLERLRVGGFSIVTSPYEAPRMSEVRKQAMDNCGKWVSKGCTCQMVDDNGQNVLALPDEFVGRVTATPRTPAMVSQVVYDQIMARKASIKLRPPAEGGTSTTRDYWGRKSGKALAVCLGWTGDTIADLRIGGSAHHYAKTPAADEATRTAAIKGCQKHEKPDCRCQIVDQDEHNVLKIPPDYTQRILEKYVN